MCDAYRGNCWGNLRPFIGSRSQQRQLLYGPPAVCLLCFLAAGCWILIGLLQPLVSPAVCIFRAGRLDGFCGLASWSAGLGVEPKYGSSVFGLPSSDLSSKLFFGVLLSVGRALGPLCFFLGLFCFFEKGACSLFC